MNVLESEEGVVVRQGMEVQMVYGCEYTGVYGEMFNSTLTLTPLTDRVMWTLASSLALKLSAVCLQETGMKSMTSPLSLYVVLG